LTSSWGPAFESGIPSKEEQVVWSMAQGDGEDALWGAQLQMPPSGEEVIAAAVDADAQPDAPSAGSNAVESVADDSITVVVDGSVGATLVGDKSLGGCTLVKQVADGGAAAFAGVQPGARLISFNECSPNAQHCWMRMRTRCWMVSSAISLRAQ